MQPVHSSAIGPGQCMILPDCVLQGSWHVFWLLSSPHSYWGAAKKKHSLLLPCQELSICPSRFFGAVTLDLLGRSMNSSLNTSLNTSSAAENEAAAADEPTDVFGCVRSESVGPAEAHVLKKCSLVFVGVVGVVFVGVVGVVFVGVSCGFCCKVRAYTLGKAWWPRLA